MKFQGALVKEQGVVFGIIIVHPPCIEQLSRGILSAGNWGPYIRASAYHPDGSEFKRRSHLSGKKGYCQFFGKYTSAGYSLA